MKRSIKAPKKNLAKVYDTIAESFDAKRRYPWKEVVAFVEQLPQDILALDLGSGNGRHTKLLHENGCNVIGLDISFKILKLALFKELKGIKKYLPGMVNADGIALPFKQESIDVIISIAVIHHFSTPNARKAVLQEMWRTIKKNGSVFLSCWLKTHPRFQREDLKHYIDDHIQDIEVPWKKENGEIVMRYYYLFEPDELIDMVEELGFKVESQTISNHNLFLTLKRRG